MSIPSKIAYEKAFEIKCFRLINEAYEGSLAQKPYNSTGMKMIFLRNYVKELI